MSKTASIGVRVDEDLKNEAQAAFDEMGIPMSLAVELFLKHVAGKRRLPFDIGSEAAPAPDPERTEREREFWRSFVEWRFEAIPHFDSDAVAERAAREPGFSCQLPGSAALAYIEGQGEGEGGSRLEASDDQRAAYRDVMAMQRLLFDAKELIYWALGMEPLFVPSLSASCMGEADQWRWQKLWARRAESLWARHLTEVGILAADPVWSRGADGGPAPLPDEKLMDLFREWLDDAPCEGAKWERLERLARETDDPDEVQGALEKAGLIDDFECYLFEESGALAGR